MIKKFFVGTNIIFGFKKIRIPQTANINRSFINFGERYFLGTILNFSEVTFHADFQQELPSKFLYLQELFLHLELLL